MRWITLMMMAFLSGALAAADIYVSPSGDDANNGSNWGVAKKTIQAAVNAAVPGDQVWVTNGTYALTAEIIVTNTITIRSVNGPEVTVVDGCGSNRCFNLSAGSIRGLTVRNGYANGGHGGGIYCANNLPVVTDCVIVSNRAKNGTTGGNGFDGGGMYQGVASNCTFIGNRAGYGGGGSNGVEDGPAGNGGRGGNGGGFFGDNAFHCVFIGNYAGGGGSGGDSYSLDIGSGGGGGDGGGMYGVIAVNCSFSNNLAGNGGYGGIELQPRSSTQRNGGNGGKGGGFYGQTADNCTFTRNRSGNGGYGKIVSKYDPGAGSGGDGGSFYGTAANDCIFKDNQTGDGGGGTGNRRGGNGGGMAGSIANRCIFSGNGTGSGGDGFAGYYTGGYGGNGGAGGGAYGIEASFCVFSSNWTGVGGTGGYGGNGADGGNGGYGGCGAGMAIGSAMNCVFINNQTGTGGDGGGGGYLGYGREGGDGGGMYFGTATHCTFYSNRTGSGGYGWIEYENGGDSDYGDGGGMTGGTANNCIAWGNTVQEITSDLSGVMANYTCAGSGLTQGVNGCITNNPRLVQFPDGYWRLGYGSPCINAGANMYANTATDLDGNVRIVDGTADMGAYEYNIDIYDSDFDQMDDGKELIAGTDPLAKADVLRITAFRDNAAFFNSSLGRQYTLLCCTNLLGGVWLPISDPHMGSGGPESIGAAQGLQQGYYKLQVKIP